MATVGGIQITTNHKLTISVPLGGGVQTASYTVPANAYVELDCASFTQANGSSTYTVQVVADGVSSPAIASGSFAAAPGNTVVFSPPQQRFPTGVIIQVTVQNSGTTGNAVGNLYFTEFQS